MTHKRSRRFELVLGRVKHEGVPEAPDAPGRPMDNESLASPLRPHWQVHWTGRRPGLRWRRRPRRHRGAGL